MRPDEREIASKIPYLCGGDHGLFSKLLAQEPASLNLMSESFADQHQDVRDKKDFQHGDIV